MDQWMREQFKIKGSFGKTTLENRRSTSAVIRKENRNNLLTKFRNIPENMSPMNSPVVSKSKGDIQENPPIEKPKASSSNRRLEMLKKWKELREKKKLETKKKEKPVFKVFHLDHKENLGDIYKTIKGKPIKKENEGQARKLRSVQNNKSNSVDSAPLQLKLNTVQVSVTKSIKPLKKNNTTSNTQKPEKISTRSRKKVDTNMEFAPKSDTATTKSKNCNVSSSESVKIDVVNDSATITLDIETISTPVKKTPKRARKAAGKVISQISTNDTPQKLQNEEITEEKKVKKGQTSKRKNRRLIKQTAVDISSQKNSSSISESEEIDVENESTPSDTSKIERVSTPLKKTPKKSRKSTGKDNLRIPEDYTPQKLQEKEICYVSPFVTMSRGKEAARKEYERRKSLNGSICNTSTATSDPTSPKAAAHYFTKILDDEIARLQNKCEIWQNYKSEANLSEDSCGLIDMTIGQCNLLITKKFNQFRGLIQKCQVNDETEMKVKNEDLHGFWDMMYKQVTDVDKRFDNLEDMKKNNWLEEEPKKKTPKVPAKGNRRGRSKKAPKATSSLKEAILAARKNHSKVKSADDVEILMVNKPATPKRKSRGKEVSTPGKGILKSSTIKSEKRKTVAFQNVRESIGDDKGSPRTPHTIKGTPIPTRRSTRLSLNRSKLVFE